MTILKIENTAEFTRALLAHVDKSLDRGFKIALPEWDKVDSRIKIADDAVSQRLYITVTFVFEPNGMS